MLALSLGPARIAPRGSSSSDLISSKGGHECVMVVGLWTCSYKSKIVWLNLPKLKGERTTNSGLVAATWDCGLGWNNWVAKYQIGQKTLIHLQTDEQWSVKLGYWIVSQKKFGLSQPKKRNHDHNEVSLIAQQIGSRPINNTKIRPMQPRVVNRVFIFPFHYIFKFRYIAICTVDHRITVAKGTNKKPILISVHKQPTIFRPNSQSAFHPCIMPPH